jgi:hypothetical protein
MLSTKEEITARLFSLQDTAYRDFQSKLVPTVSPDSVIGVRTPAVKELAKTLVKEAAVDEGTASAVQNFLTSLPHKF